MMFKVRMILVLLLKKTQKKYENNYVLVICLEEGIPRLFLKLYF